MQFKNEKKSLNWHINFPASKLKQNVKDRFFKKKKEKNKQIKLELANVSDSTVNKARCCHRAKMVVINCRKDNNNSLHLQQGNLMIFLLGNKRKEIPAV